MKGEKNTNQSPKEDNKEINAKKEWQTPEIQQISMNNTESGGATQADTALLS